MEVKLTLDEVLNHLKTLQSEIPYYQLPALISNEDYSPNDFNQEMEDSEREITLHEKVEWLKENGFFSTGMPDNSDEWKDNHSKICTEKLTYAGVLIKNNDTFDTEHNRELVTNWYNGITQEGLNVFKLG